MGIFSKITSAANLALDNYIAKSQAGGTKSEYNIERKAFSSDDISNTADLGYRERPSAITCDILRQMSQRDSIVAAVIQTRVNRIKNFGKIQPTKYDFGIKVVMRDGDAHPSDKESKEMNELEKWFTTCGSNVGRKPEHRCSLVDFLTIITRDVLVYDQVAIEKVPNKANTLAYFLPVSSGSIRFATKNLSQNEDVIESFNQNPSLVSGFSEEAQAKEEAIIQKDLKRDEDYRFVQLHRGKIVKGFFNDELIFKFMNPVSDLDTEGYSVGPLEYLANIVSYHLFTEAHNRQFFTQGFASRGILHIEGDVPPQQLEAFRRTWREQVSGVQNSWRTPILAGANKISWVDLNSSNRDMEFNFWMEYLIKIICAIYTIAPQEINFDITRAGAAGLGESGSRNESLLSDSHDRGLRPLLDFFESILNDDILQAYDEALYNKYKVIFVGLNSETREQELERQIREMSNFKTINEIRAENDLPSIEGGDVVANGIWWGWFNGYSKDAEKRKKQEAELGAVASGGDKKDKPYEAPVNQGTSDKQVKKSLITDPTIVKIEYYKDE